MSPQEAYQTLLGVLNGGSKINGVNIECKDPVEIYLEQESDTRIKISFPANQPIASFRRLITLSATIQSITLKEDSGFVVLKNFPAIPFGYESFFFGHLSDSVDTSDIEYEIKQKYCQDKQEIASLCLQYAKDWATISSQGVCFKSADKHDKRRLKKQCFDFVVENVRKDVEKRHGSVILTYIFLVLILPAVAKFIINKLLEKYF
tara:strand:- start:243 stop:857 length:615 start_codon:yes stop_codon:yes gene_type:complete